MPWWSDIPGRLESEYSDLAAIGATFVERQDEKANGFLVLDLTFPTEGQVLELEVRFPDTYPYTRPEIYAPNLKLPHHQNPIAHNLCVLGRASENWTPGMSLADLLREQIPKVLAANALPKEQAAAIEEHQGEPVSAFFPFAPDAVAFVDGAWKVPTTHSIGLAQFGVVTGADSLTIAVASLLGGDNNFALPALQIASGTKVHPGRWVQLTEPIVRAQPHEFDEELGDRVPQLKTRQYPYGLDCILIGFPEEHGWRQDGQGWALLVRKKQTAKGSIKNDLISLIRVQRVGVADYAARVPAFSELQEARVVLFGAGCVGAPLALQLARGGVGHLSVVDPDIVEAAATARWPMGLAAAGHPKVKALRDFILAHHPRVRFTGYPHRVGGALLTGGPLHDSQILPELYSNADVVIDATAEFGIQRLLSDLALRRNVPYIGVHATNGGYGGQLFRIVRGRTGCWNCLAWHQAEGVIPNPPSLDAEWTQPTGCAAPTFIGASWDLEELSLSAARLTVATLTGDSQGWDVGIASISPGDLPVWTKHALPPHPNCAPCLAK